MVTKSVNVIIAIFTNKTKQNIQHRDIHIKTSQHRIFSLYSLAVGALLQWIANNSTLKERTIRCCLWWQDIQLNKCMSNVAFEHQALDVEIDAIECSKFTTRWSQQSSCSRISTRMGGATSYTWHSCIPILGDKIWRLITCYNYCNITADNNFWELQDIIEEQIFLNIKCLSLYLFCSDLRLWVGKFSQAESW